MQTIIYYKPYPHKENLWIYGYSKTRYEKVGMYLMHKGSEKEAQEKIDGYSCKKYRKRS